MPSSAHDRLIEITTLSNGLKVITEAMPYVRSVSIGVWVDAGSRREEGAESGISHFIEHMVFKGTPTRSAEQIARTMDSLGGHLDAFTGKELVCFNTKVLDEHLPEAFDVLSDMLLRPAFREEDIRKEKSVILEELKMENDNPEYLVHETFSSNFWKNEPLGQPILGTRETIEGFSREMIDGYYRSIYTPANLIVTAAGNLTHHRIVEMVRAQFEGLKPGKELKPQPVPKTQAHLVLRKKKELEQVHLMMGVPAYSVSHEMRFPAYVLNTLLGGSMSSRLFQNIREKRGLVYAVFSDLNMYKDSGCLGVYAGTGRETVQEVIQLVLEEFRRLKEEPVSEEELLRGKNHLKGSLMLGLESTSSRMTNLARQQLYYGRFFSLDEIIEKIDAVTAAEIQQVAQDFFRPDRLSLTALGQLNGLKIGRKQLVC
ncbi:MAG: insulinase family protein [Acidimicrobiia bacterium]|nr:insulinase family protein [Acidimicrobiia bacterium]